MGADHFRKWLLKDENQFFWKEVAVPSERMDELLTDRAIQKSIAGSSKNQYLYSFIENRIVNDYADLIDCKLRAVFSNIPIIDFRNPVGFECEIKSSSAQKKYFKRRHALEFFLKGEIQQHAQAPDAQLNAFRRWVEISDALLKRHCYEGFILIFVNLQLLAQPQWLCGLPAGLQDKYYEMCALSSPLDNYLALRTHIRLNQHESDLSPVILTCQAINSLNCSMDLILENRIKLQEKENLLNSAITALEHKERYRKKVKALNREIEATYLELWNNTLFHCDQVRQRTALLNQIAKEQKYSTKPMPEHLEKTYKEIHIRHKAHSRRSIRNWETFDQAPRNKSKPATLSKLYSQNLLPSFWGRGGKSADEHWKEVFSGTSSSRKN